MTSQYKVWVFLAVVAIYAGVVSQAHAVAPTLSLATTNGDSVQITVHGDPNVGVTFYYNLGSASGVLSTSLGFTDASGTFSTIISSNGYAVTSGSLVYIIVNGQQSSIQTWPYGAAGSSGTGSLSLSQNSVSVGVGQSASVSVQGSSSGVYLLSNGSPSVAMVATNGTQVTVTGQQTGSTNVTLCAVGSASNCTTLVVAVGGNTGTGSFGFSPNTLSLSIGQGANVALSGGSSYYISATTNASVSSQIINNSTMTVTGLTNGAATLTVCSVSPNACGSLPLTVGTGSLTATSATTAATGKITFAVSNPTVIVGQTLNIGVSGGSGGYTLSNNPNPNMVQATVGGSTIVLTGVGAGSTFVTVCDTANSNVCGTIFFNVVSDTTSPQISQGILSPAVVSPVPTVITQNSSSASLRDVLATIQTMQSQLVQLLSQLQAMQNSLSQLISKVAPTTPASSGNISFTGYVFTLALEKGSAGMEVLELQKKLTALGFYSGPLNGSFGLQTEAAVKAFQIARGISAQGNVGPSTRRALNAE